MTNEKDIIPDRNVDGDVPSNVPYDLVHDNDTHNKDNEDTKRVPQNTCELSKLSVAIDDLSLIHI